MVGMAQLASAPDCGSGGRGFESLYPPYPGLSQGTSLVKNRFEYGSFNGLSPSGKAQGFDPCIRWFESS